MTLLTDLAVAARKSGLKVIELTGWKGNVSAGGFDPDGVLCHHTGSFDDIADPADDLAYAKWLAFTGRSDLPPPLCNLALSAECVVYVCSAGNANHAGKAKASGPMPSASDGNALYVGIEAMNSGSQGWDSKGVDASGKEITQYEAYVRLCAALCQNYSWPATHVRGHKETSVTGKIDPRPMDMDKFRADIAAEMEVKDLNITARFQAGLWKNVDEPSFVANDKRMKRGKCTLVGRTECTDQSSNRVIKLPGDDWGGFHPKMEGRPIDCALEFHLGHWDKVDEGVKQLTDFRVTTKGGVHLLPSVAPWLLLRSLDAPKVMALVSVAHNNLDNTEPRALGWLDEADTFQHWSPRMQQALEKQHPGFRIVRIHMADVNKDFLKPSERSMVRKHMLEGTGLKWGWSTKQRPQPDIGKQLISYTFSNADRVTSKGMAGDKFSDHDPHETSLFVGGR